MNSLWDCINSTTTDDMDELIREYEDKVRIVASKMNEYFTYHSPSDFIKGTCLGIDLSPNVVLEYIDCIIMSGEEIFNSFIENPFNGMLANKLYREHTGENFYVLKFKKMLVVSFDQMFSVRTGHLTSVVFDIFISNFV